jgi:hypothetical protein
MNLKFLWPVLKSPLGIFLGIIIVLAGACLTASMKGEQGSATIKLLIGGCLLIILCCLVLVYFLVDRHGEDLFGKNHAIDPIMVCYYLRGVRYQYLNDGRSALKFRVNIMQPTTVRGDQALTITITDYANEFSSTELQRYWLKGQEKCGDAWQTKTQQYYAIDDGSAKAAFNASKNAEGASPTELQSVLSTPILLQSTGKCIGVLNFDSPHPAKDTGVNQGTVQALFSEAARLIAPALSRVGRDANG